MEPCCMVSIPRFILPVCLLMAPSCLHPQGLIASHLSKCAWCLKRVYRFVRIPESLSGPRFLWSVKASVCLCFSSSLLLHLHPLSGAGGGNPALTPCSAPVSGCWGASLHGRPDLETKVQSFSLGRGLSLACSGWSHFWRTLSSTPDFGGAFAARLSVVGALIRKERK